MLQILKSWFGGHKSNVDESDDMKKYLIIGLGNIGDDYADTRHNVGFKVLDALSQGLDFTFESSKLGALGSFKIKGKNVLCLKPSTYMNLSGKAVKYWMDKEKIPLENLLIVTDDINLPFGTIRLKSKGSDGGHNGLKDVQNILGTTNYNRLRFGVGADFGKGRQVDYVLGEWSEEERGLLKERFQITNELVRSFVQAGMPITMNKYNGT